MLGGGSRLQVGPRHEEPAGKQCCKLLLKPLAGKDSLKSFQWAGVAWSALAFGTSLITV